MISGHDVYFLTIRQSGQWILVLMFEIMILSKNIKQTLWFCFKKLLALSWRRPLSYRNQSINLQSKSMDWFLYDNGLCHDRVNSSVIYQVSSSKPISAQRSASALRFTGSYMKCNAGMKWVQITYLEIIQIDLLDLFKPFKFILSIKKR